MLYFVASVRRSSVLCTMEMNIKSLTLTEVPRRSHGSGGGEGTLQSFIREGSTLMSNRLPFCTRIWFWKERCPFHIPWSEKREPLSGGNYLQYSALRLANCCRLYLRNERPGFEVRIYQWVVFLGKTLYSHIASLHSHVYKWAIFSCSVSKNGEVRTPEAAHMKRASVIDLCNREVRDFGGFREKGP